MIRLRPIFKEKVWGSTHLEPLFPNSSEKIGEVWFEGVVKLPILIKFLFTSENLSVQVHPEGKTEMWHVLRAEPGAQVAAGFKEPITAQRLREASLSGEIENLLQWFDAAPGDTFFIPAGTVHAIGAGLTLCEIQQHSDVTYRLYDYGRPRELHLDQALEVSHLGPYAARQNTHGEVLVSCPYFTTSKVCMSKSEKHIPPSETLQLICLIDGSGSVGEQPTRAGDVWYLEAGVREIGFSGDGNLLRISV